MLMSIRLVTTVTGPTSHGGKSCARKISAAASKEITSEMKPDTVQNTARLAITSALTRNSRANHLSWMVAARRPTTCARVFGTMPVAAIQPAGSPVTPRRSSAIAVERIGGIQPSKLGEIAESGAEIEQESGQRDPRPAGGAERAAELFDHVAERDRLRLHQVPRHGVRRVDDSRAASQAMVAAISSTATGWNGVADSPPGKSSGNAASARSIALPP